MKRLLLSAAISSVVVIGTADAGPREGDGPVVVAVRDDFQKGRKREQKEWRRWHRDQERAARRWQRWDRYAPPEPWPLYYEWAPVDPYFRTPLNPPVYPY